MAAATRARSCCLLVGAELLLVAVVLCELRLGAVVECGMSIETISVVVVIEFGRFVNFVWAMMVGSCTISRISQYELRPLGCEELHKQLAGGIGSCSKFLTKSPFWL